MAIFHGILGIPTSLEVAIVFLLSFQMWWPDGPHPSTKPPLSEPLDLETPNSIPHTTLWGPYSRWIDLSKTLASLVSNLINFNGALTSFSTFQGFHSLVSTNLQDLSLDPIVYPTLLPVFQHLSVCSWGIAGLVSSTSLCVIEVQVILHLLHEAFSVEDGTPCFTHG